VTTSAIVLVEPEKYEFVDTDIVGVGRCIRRAGRAGAGMLVDTPSLCGRVLLGSRYTRPDAPERGLPYHSASIVSRIGTLSTFCQECLYIWRQETGQEVANDTAPEDAVRKELAAVRKNCARYEARVLELDKRMEAMRLMSRGEWCALKELVDEYCQRQLEAKS
jgi:hypothetical protein